MNLQQQRTNQKFDVIIVGAGIVGLSAALALSQQNFRVALVEAQLHPNKNRPLAEYGTKVVAVTRASENFFKYLNIWQTIVES
ncbi:MAG: FAD-dependent oxidoreductase, partial [Candidatus Berkiella sp.]